MHYTVSAIWHWNKQTKKNHVNNTRVGSHVPLQFVSIPAGIAAQAALERTLPSVRTNVAFQFANLKAKNKTEVSIDEQVRLPEVQVKKKIFILPCH